MKQKRRNKLLSLGLVLLMVFGLMPGMSLTADAAENYKLWVGSTQVTSGNRNDILGDGGSAKYNPSTKTLTLNNPKISAPYTGKSRPVGIYADFSDVSDPLKIEGTLDLTNLNLTDGIYVEGANRQGDTSNDAKLELNGTIKIKSSNYGIGTRHLTVTGGKVTINAGLGIYSTYDFKTTGGTVDAVNGIYSPVVTIDGGQVIATTKSSVKGAIDGAVNTTIDGTGWTNTEGTEGKAKIAAGKYTDTDLQKYKKVQFLAAKDPAKVMKAPTANALTYTGRAQALIIAGSATGGTMQYALGNNTAATGTYSAAIPVGTDAGTYYVWYKVKGDADHYDSSPAFVTVKIATKEDSPTKQPENKQPKKNSPAKKTEKKVSGRIQMNASLVF